jgi:putative selenium metabolism hydrolase
MTVPLDFDRLTHFLASMVKVESLSGQEKSLVELVASEMHRLEFDHVYVDEIGSLVGTVAGDKSGPTLLLDAHCDTVGVAPGVSWQFDPFGAVIRNDRMYGRGTSDMKGALAAMIYAAAGVERSLLAGRVVVSVTVMEEVMEGASLGAVMAEIRPDFVVIGEATNLNLNHGGRGRAEIHLEAIGRPAHSSTPEMGVNAVHLMVAAIRAIEEMPLPSDPALGPAIMALTDIISDPYPGYSVVPSRCRVSYDRRLLVGETMDGVIAEIRARPALEGIDVVIANGEHTAYTGAVIGGPKFFPAWKLSPDHRFVQLALTGLRNAGLQADLESYRFCTNAAYSAGRANVPTVGFGPSTEGHAHVVNEFIDLPQLQKAALGYLGIIESVLS